MIYACLVFKVLLHVGWADVVVNNIFDWCSIQFLKLNIEERWFSNNAIVAYPEVL